MPYQLDYIRTNHNNQVMPGDRPTMNQAIDSQSPAHVTVLQYGIGVFDLGVQVGSWEPKEHDAGVNKSLVEDQLAEIAVEQTQGDDLTQFLSWVEKNRVDWDSPTRFSRVDIEGLCSTWQLTACLG